MAGLYTHLVISMHVLAALQNGVFEAADLCPRHQPHLATLTRLLTSHADHFYRGSLLPDVGYAPIAVPQCSGNPLGSRCRGARRVIERVTETLHYTGELWHGMAAQLRAWPNSTERDELLAFSLGVLCHDLVDVLSHRQLNNMTDLIPYWIRSEMALTHMPDELLGENRIRRMVDSAFYTQLVQDFPAWWSGLYSGFFAASWPNGTESDEEDRRTVGQLPVEDFVFKIEALNAISSFVAADSKLEWWSLLAFPTHCVPALLEWVAEVRAPSGPNFTFTNRSWTYSRRLLDRSFATREAAEFYAAHFTRSSISSCFRTTAVILYNGGSQELRLLSEHTFAGRWMECDDAPGAPPSRRASASSPTTSADILDLVERAPAVEALDASSLRKMVLALERKVTRNQEARARFAGEPEKFMDSEVELDEELKRLNAVATAPNLYADFVSLGAVQTVLGLLEHENADIAIDVVLLLQEMTTYDEESEVDQHDRADSTAALVDALIEHHAVEALVKNLARLAAQAAAASEDKTDAEAGEPEAEAMFGTLAIFENIVEAKPEEAETIAAQGQLLAFLLSRCKEKAFDAVKGYAAELLSVLMQGSAVNQERVGAANGIECLLEAIALYRKTDPPTPDEEEFVENVFDCLCSALLLPENQKRFDVVEGIELMLLLLKEKKFCRRGALRALDFHLQNNPVSCARFVEALGLKTLFAAFMKKGIKKLKGTAEREDDEHVVSCIVSLLKGLEPSSPLYARLVAKFSETEFEKLERLLELYEAYLVLVNAADRHAAQTRAQMLREGRDPNSEQVQQQEFLDRLEAGLSVLQNVCLIMVLVSLADKSIKEHLMGLLKLRSLDAGRVREVVRGMADAIGGDDPERASKDPSPAPSTPDDAAVAVEASWESAPLRASLSMAGVAVLYEALVSYRFVKGWRLCRCLNCARDVYACLNEDPSRIVIDPLLKARAPLPTFLAFQAMALLPEGMRYSPCFKVAVDANPEPLSEACTPTASDAHAMDTFALLQQQAQKAFVEQEERMLESLRQQANRDRNALWHKFFLGDGRRRPRSLHTAPPPPCGLGVPGTSPGKAGVSPGREILIPGPQAAQARAQQHTPGSTSPWQSASPRGLESERDSTPQEEGGTPLSAGMFDFDEDIVIKCGDQRAARRASLAVDDTLTATTRMGEEHNVVAAAFLDYSDEEGECRSRRDSLSKSVGASSKSATSGLSLGRARILVEEEHDKPAIRMPTSALRASVDEPAASSSIAAGSSLYSASMPVAVPPAPLKQSSSGNTSHLLRMRPPPSPRPHILVNPPSSIRNASRVYSELSVTTLAACDATCEDVSQSFIVPMSSSRVTGAAAAMYF
eukprot:m51a1_g3807 hypothetical protein (1348) ;mRNA; r:245266-251184